MLRKKYLTGFGRLGLETDSVACAPIREIQTESDSTNAAFGLIKKVWDKIFDKDESEQD